MQISELIAKLEVIKAEEGDIPICISEPHEYWGYTSFLLKDWDLNVTNHAQPDGPKSGIEVKAVLIGK
jgi:hypothetical protein